MNWMVLHLKKINSPTPKDALCQVRLKLVEQFWRKKIYKFRKCILLFRNYLPFRMGVALHLSKFESSSPKDDMCQVWSELAQWFWRIFFFNFANVLCYFVIISPDEMTWTFIWTNLNSRDPMLLCALFGRYWLSVLKIDWLIG